MVKPRVLSIREAASALNLSEARVHQLLGSGALEGPGLPAGRRRHRPGVPRVTAESIRRYVQLGATSGSHGSISKGSRPQDPRARHAPAAEAAAHELKIRMDALRDEVRRERARNHQLLALAATLLDMLRDTTSSADHLDDVAEGYSQALSQLLSVDNPLGDRRS